MTTDQAFDIIFLHTGISRQLLASKNGCRVIVKARQQFVYLCRKFIKIDFYGIERKVPLKIISKLLNKDHSTIIHYLQTIEDHLSYDKNLMQEIIELEKYFNPEYNYEKPLEIL